MSSSRIAHSPKDLPENAAILLQETAAKHLENRHEDPALWSLWHPRFERIANYFITHENRHRETALPLKTESKGHLKIQNFILTGIADRIDKTPQNHAILIDYKSGGTFSQKAFQNGEYPQLPLEALILKQGGFNDAPAMDTSSLQYWVLNGSGQGGKITTVNDEPLEELLHKTQQNFETLIAIFNNPETPYLSLPRPDKAPRFNDYLHLARVQEWASLSDDNESEAA